jgi:putative ABC transport system substrate-binding protein
VKRRHLLGAVLGSVATQRSNVVGAQGRDARRIGVLSQGRLDDWPLSGLVKGLSELGRTSQTLFIDHTPADGYSNLAALAKQLVEKKPEVIVVYGAVPARAALALTTSTPVVTVSGTDPVEVGLSDSFARPSGNVTGFVGSTPEVHGKRIELVREVLPSSKRVAVFFNPSTLNEYRFVEQLVAYASPLGLEVMRVEIRQAADLSAAVFSQLGNLGLDALVTVPSVTLATNAKQIGALATSHRLPGLFHSREFVVGGGLASFGANTYETFRLVAGYVDRILSGTKVSDLPFQRPQHIELVVNMRAAEQLGVSLPHSLLFRADEVLE